MHVEIRVSEISTACCLEPESFFRVKQLLASHIRAKPLDDLQSTPGTSTHPPSVAGPHKKRDLLSLYGNTSSGKAAQKIDERTFAPQLRVQFVLERVVKMETSDLATRRDRVQHEKQVKSKWDGSDIRTQRFSAFPCEVLLASLPPTVMDCVVKIRLLQLPPKLPQNGAGARLAEAIGCDVNSEECRYDTPLCIGVTKITLKELMSVRGGVRMTLQAKRTVTSLVEELNLNTIATNAMFGKDVGGSAFLTFQVVPYAFGKVPFSKLLLFKEAKQSTPSQQNSADDNVDSISRQSSIGGKSFDAQSGRSSSPTPQYVAEQLGTPAVRFMLVPYMAAIETGLRVHDALSWRRPLKTMLLLLMVAVVMWADVIDVALFMGGAVELFFFLRSVSIFYHTPLANNGARALVSPLTSPHSSTVYLYGRQNVFVNTLVRCRLFFANGLQEDCFYEMALIFHLVRRRQRALLVRATLVTLCLLIVSVETLFALILFICFVSYPISLRLPNLRSAKKNDQSANGDSGTLRQSLTFFWRAYRLNRPMQIARVVKIAVPQRAPTPPSRRLLDAAGSASGVPSVGRLPSIKSYSLSGPSAVFMNSLHGRTETNYSELGDAASAAGDGIAVSEVSSAKKSVSSRGTFTAHRRAYTMDGVGPIDRPSQPFMLDGTHILRNPSTEPLSFAIVSFTCDLGTFTDGGQPLSSTTVVSRNSPSAALVGRLVRHMTLAEKVVASTTLGTDRSNMYRRFFHETFNLLFFVRRNVTYQAYVTPNSFSSKTPPPTELLRSDIFVRPTFLVTQGVDDSVTAALLAKPKTVTSPQVMKLPPMPGADNAARALALMAAALLQGSRLSIYTPGPTSRNCSLIVPLRPNSDRIEQRLVSNPCPPPLFSALEEMWCNKQSAASPGDMTISADMVLQVISTYRTQSSQSNALLSGSPLPNNNSMTAASPSSPAPDEAPHVPAPRRSFFQSLTKNTSNQASSGNRSPRLSQTFYGTLPEGRRTSGADKLQRENSGVRASGVKRNSGAHERSSPSSPLLGHESRQISTQSSFEPPELKATHTGGEQSSPLRSHLHSQEEVPPQT